MSSDTESPLSEETVSKKSELKHDQNFENFDEAVTPSYTTKAAFNAKRQLFHSKFDQSTKTHKKSSLLIETTTKKKSSESHSGADNGKPRKGNDRLSIPQLHLSPSARPIGDSTHSLSPKASAYQSRVSAGKENKPHNYCNDKSDPRSCCGSKKRCLGGSGDKSPPPLAVKFRKNNEDTGYQVR